MIEKNECLVGNIFVVNDKVSSLNDSWNHLKENGLSCFGNKGYKCIEIPVGTKIEILKFKSSIAYFKVLDTSDVYYSYWSGFKVKLDNFEGNVNRVLESKPRYKIFYKGKALKPKYFNDLGKIKASLLISFGYYTHQYEIFMKYQNRNQELADNYVPDWCTGSNDFDRGDCKDIQIMEYVDGCKLGTPIDFDVTNYYDQSMKLIDVTAQFGNAARELYKNTMQSGDYSYLLVYSPDEYRDTNNYSVSHGYMNCNFDYSKLKENQKIKDVIKDSKVKGIKKCTKYGKTAIVFHTLAELKEVMLRLDPQEYFILDCEGDQLVEQNQRFIKLSFLKAAIKEKMENKESI